MNKDVIEGKWGELKGKVKTKWAKLTDDDLTLINGRVEELSGSLQKIYGWSREKTKKEVEEFRKSLH